MTLGADDAKTIKWMTGSTPCQSNFHNWATLLGYPFDGHRPCGARFQAPVSSDKTKLEGLYGEDGIVGTITGLLPVYDQLVTLLRDFIAPSGGNNDAIRSQFVELLYHAHTCAESDNNDGDFAIDVMDFIFHELYDAMVNRKTIPYAPYIMLLIKDQFPDQDMTQGCVEHKVKRPYKKKKNALGAAAPPRASRASQAREASANDANVRKLNWFQRNVLCMNVAIHKENYEAYKERKTILDNQALILHRLSNTGGDDPAPSAPIAYPQWQSSVYDWREMERCLQGSSSAPPPPPPGRDGDDIEEESDSGDYEDDEDDDGEDTE
jgi:hypothetical protein